MSEIKITEKKESLLLSRTEITAEMPYSGVTPKKEEIKSKLATALSAKENLVVVKKIHTKYGDKKAKISFYVYDNEKDMLDIEPKKKDKKKKEPKAPKPEEKPKEEKPKEPEAKEEKPKEEKKEEAKEETKKEKPAEGKK